MLHLVIPETRERFIRAIAERLAAERIVEAYFFPPIRQGPVETGVAVLAASLTAPAVRAEVLTASYRWTRKGPERGTWVVELVAEAHAPIVTVEAVVRGVQERAGEALDAHRMSGDELRALLQPADGAGVEDAAVGG